MTDAISYAKSLIDITEEEYSVIMHSKRILLFQNSEPWVKKDGNDDFDVPMGCYDGAEICELVGFYSRPYRISNRQIDIGLYRNDGLGIFCEISKSMIERKKKLIVKTFKQCRLAITIEFNLKTVNFFEHYI